MMTFDEQMEEIEAAMDGYLALAKSQVRDLEAKYGVLNMRDHPRAQMEMMSIQRSYHANIQPLVLLAVQIRRTRGPQPVIVSREDLHELHL